MHPKFSVDANGRKKYDSPTWGHVQTQSYAVLEGEHTFSILEREDGCQIRRVSIEKGASCRFGKAPSTTTAPATTNTIGPALSNLQDAFAKMQGESVGKAELKAVVEEVVSMNAEVVSLTAELDKQKSASADIKKLVLDVINELAEVS